MHPKSKQEAEPRRESYVVSNSRNSRIRGYVREMKPMLEAGLNRLKPDDTMARVRYEEALQLCHTIDTCVDELPPDVMQEAKQLFEFVASQVQTGDRVN